MSHRDGQRPSFPTRVGYGGGVLPPNGAEGPPRPSAAPEPAPYDSVPMLEVEAIYQQGPVPQDEPLRILEVWTRNRIYKMSPAMLCVEVVDRATGAVDRGSEFLGQRLVGGQLRDGAAIELSHPFPRPGAEAVFERAAGASGALSRTSIVSRVVLRLHVVKVDPRGVAPTWAELKKASIIPPP
jgi:hypothetical protein